MKRAIAALLALLVIGAAEIAAAQDLSRIGLARLKYGGGGDWYGDTTSLVNLHREMRDRFHLEALDQEPVVEPSDPNLFNYPLLYMTGHGTVRFTEEDVRNLREYFRRGGVLWADDDYGLDEHFRREIAKVFPDHPLVEIPHDHPIFTIFYPFEEGLPKIHEHDGKPPQLFGIFLNGRIAVLYTYETDIGDGLESEGIHPDDTPEIREKAMQMALNLMLYVLSS